MRSTITRYAGGSPIFVPVSRTNSAVIPCVRPSSFTRSRNAGGNAYSRPHSRPIFMVISLRVVRALGLLHTVARLGFFTWGSAPHPGSVARGAPPPRSAPSHAPRARLRRHRRARPVPHVARLGFLTWGSAPHPGSVARGAPPPRSAPSHARRARLRRDRHARTVPHVARLGFFTWGSAPHPGS